MGQLSVVIPSYNRSLLTAKHVEYCMQSTILPDEIIVVNDSGDIGLRDLLLNLERNVKIIYAYIEENILWNYNGACNLGVWLSTGDVIALEDCDHIPESTTYENGLKALEDKTVERIAFRRKVVDINEVFTKPMNEWNIIKGWGSNQMVTMMRRSMYLKLKGQDERFSGRYGFMAMDWASRYRKAGIKTSTTNFYWAVIGDEGEPNLQRGMHPGNRKIYKENANAKQLHSAYGILNFHYVYEVL